MHRIGAKIGALSVIGLFVFGACGDAYRRRIEISHYYGAYFTLLTYVNAEILKDCGFNFNAQPPLIFPSDDIQDSGRLGVYFHDVERVGTGEKVGVILYQTNSPSVIVHETFHHMVRKTEQEGKEVDYHCLEQVGAELLRSLYEKDHYLSVRR